MHAAIALADRMSVICKRCWQAPWTPTLDRDLWAMLDGAPRTCGVTDQDLAILRDLSERCAGWWRFDEAVGEEVFVPLEEWRERVSR